MFKSFCAYSQQDYSKMLSMENQTKQSPEISENNPFEKMSTKIYSQNFVTLNQLSIFFSLNFIILNLLP